MSTKVKVLLGTLIVCLFGVVPSSAVASSPVVYSANDTSADTTGAPDISTVTVADNTQGLVTFQITLVAGSYQLTQDSISVYIDADQNPTTGDTSAIGAEYLLAYDGATNTIGLFKWDGASSYKFLDTKSLTGSFAGDSQFFAIAAADLGITDGFNFNVAAAVGPDAGASSQVDFVPEADSDFHYSIQSKFAITLSSKFWGWDTPHAGKGFRTGLILTRSDTKAFLTSGTIRCRMTLGGKSVPLGGHAFQKLRYPGKGLQPTAVCAWRLPPGTVGETLTATETVSLGGSQVTRTVRLRVRK